MNLRFSIRPYWRTALLVLLLFFMSLQFAQAGWIYFKAELAQVLIHRAWQNTLEQGSPQKPWNWADTWPQMRLQWQGRTDNEAVDLMVLEGTHGSSLAFGPGHYPETAEPGKGSVVLAAHRDTHFAFLENVRSGDRLRLQNSHGEWFSYRVTSLEVVDSRATPLLINPDEQRLILMTCYPFDALRAGGPLRYLVSAVPESPSGNRQIVTGK